MPRNRRIADDVILLLAVAFAVGAIDSAHTEQPNADATRALSALFWASLALAIGWAGINRIRREGGRRPWFVLLVTGFLVWLIGHTARLVLLSEATRLDARVVAAPWVLGLVLTTIGLIGVAWPSGMSTSEALHITIDIGLGIAALAVIWSFVVVPRWPVRQDPAQMQAGSVAQWALFVGLAVMIVFIASGRRTSSLPLIQLTLLFAAFEVLLLSAVLRELANTPQGVVTYALLGYWFGIALLTLMLQRSSAEVEGQRQKNARVVVAFAVPGVLVFVAGLIIIDIAAQSRPDSILLSAAPVIWGVALTAVLVGSAQYMLTFRSQRNEEQMLRLAQSSESGWIGALLRDSSEYLFVLDTDTRIVYASPRTQAMLRIGERLHDVVLEPSKATLDTLLSGVAAQALESRPLEMTMQAQDGSRRITMMRMRPVQDVAFEGFVVSGTDETEARRLAEQLESTGQRDRLTGLLSSQGLSAALSAQCQTANELAYAVIDLVDFGIWNDSLGRNVGDEILRAVAMSLESLPDPVIAVGRVGGDSFGILLTAPEPHVAMLSCLRDVTGRLRELVIGDGTEFELSMRAGYTTSVPSTSGAANPDLILEQADVALRRGRRTRHATIVRFQKGMNEDLVQLLSAELLVREAINKESVVVQYQPVISLRDGHPVSVEALVRIQSGNDLIQPGSFIEAAERTGLIMDVDRAVRRIVCEDWPTISAASSLRQIAVNVSEKELTMSLADELEASGCIENISVEVTESSILTNPDEAGECLRRIQAAGGKVGIDDFGTGYSSMAQIASLPCDLLKIDRSFVASMIEDPKSMSLVRAMIRLGHDLGLEIVAEGVESVDQAASLRALGCDYAQGFYYSRPKDLSDLLAWLAEQPGPTSTPHSV